MEGLALDGVTIHNPYPEGDTSWQTMAVDKWLEKCKGQEINI